MKKINENTKITLTFGQLKRLVRESDWNVSPPGSWYEPPDPPYNWTEKTQAAWMKPLTDLEKNGFTVKDALATFESILEKRTRWNWPPAGPDEVEYWVPNEKLVGVIKEAIDFCKDALRKGLNEDDETIAQVEGYIDEYIPEALPPTVEYLQDEEEYYASDDR